jgi:hypothetical protein
MESLAPFLQGTCTPYNMPVYPGAQRQIANALTDDKKQATWTYSRIYVQVKNFRFARHLEACANARNVIYD